MFSLLPNSTLDWMETTWLNQLAIGYAWSWPTMESLHFIGMALLFGSLIIMDLRLVGFDRTASIIATDKLVPIAYTGFGINLMTGILFCFGDPHRYAINISFQMKVLFLFLAGVNFLIFKFVVEPRVATVGPGDDPPSIAKIVGATSLLFWTAVLCFGRLIPYLGTG